MKASENQISITLAAGIVFGLLMLANAAMADSYKTLPNHVPGAVSKHILQDQGPLPDLQPFSMTIALELNNEADLDQKLHDLYDPKSPIYRHYLTPAQFRAAYGATADQIQAIKGYLSSYGITVSEIKPNGYLVSATGQAKGINAAFQTELHAYKDAKGSNYFAPSKELQVPANLPIMAVHGLENVIRLRPNLKLNAGNVGSRPNVLPLGNGIGNGLIPSDIQKIYNFPTNLNGSGQTIALFELTGYDTNDIATYIRQYSLPTPTITTVLVNGFSGQTDANSIEAVSDIDLVAGLAPGAQILVYEGVNNSAGVINTYSEIAEVDLAQQVSTSWGLPENGSSPREQYSEYEALIPVMRTEYNIFKQMATQGQSIFAAAGDSGAEAQLLVVPQSLWPPEPTWNCVNDPASQPYITSVGGATLTVTAPNTMSLAYSSETAWQQIVLNGVTNLSGTEGAGGGGFSDYWPLPSYQTTVVSGSSFSATLGSTTYRNLPDVSMNGDNNTGYSIYSAGVTNWATNNPPGWGVLGGTSCGAPIWAAFAALVNQAYAQQGIAPLGFANPILYQIGLGPSYHSDFHDIADNSNNLYYPAVPGFDDATGWGSLNGVNLLNDLVCIGSTGSVCPPPAPTIISATMTSGVLQIYMTSVAGYLYTAQYSTNPAAPFPWTPLQTTATGTGSIITVTDSNPTDARRFYIGVLTGPAP